MTTEQWATSLFGLVFRSVFSLSPNSDWAKVKPKSEVDFFVRTQSKGLSEKTELICLVWSSDSVQMNLHATDRLIPLLINFRWSENHFTFSISPNKPNRQEIRFISAMR